MTGDEQYREVVIALASRRPDRAKEALRGLVKCIQRDARDLAERDTQLAELYDDLDNEERRSA